jgi:hypothetical protein
MLTTLISNKETQVHFYNNLKSRKFSWTPINPIPGEYNKDASDLFGRSLALRVLEIPVGEFITEASKKEFNVPNESLDLFFSNVADEEVHDKQLQIAHDNYKFTTQQHQAEANQILQQWIDLSDHPLVKATILERSIFFIILPMLRMFGDTALRTISQDISRKQLIAA